MSKSIRIIYHLILTIFLLSIALSLYATTTSRQTEKCPACNTEFDFTVIMSTTTFGGKDYDFCYDAAGDPHPLLVYPITCPRCLYSGFGDDFKPETKIDETLKNKILNGKIFTPYAEIKMPKSSDDFPAWVRYDLVAQTYQANGKGDEDVADCFLKASWSVRIETEPLSVITKELSSKAWELIRNTWQKNEAANQGRYYYEIVLGKKFLEQMFAKSGDEKELNGLAAIYLLRKHGENTDVLKILSDIKNVMSKDEFEKISRGLNESVKNERYFQAKAVAVYEKLSKNTEKIESKVYYTYLCGELHRRLENWDKSREFYQAASKFKECPDWIIKYIKEQLNLLPKK